MKLISYFILLFLTPFCFSQQKANEISGIIINSESKEVLQYVNIGVPNKSAGTVSNKEGKFKLVLPNTVKLTDTISFSHVGFESKKISVSEFSNSTEPIQLNPEENTLSEVVVKLKTPKPKKIGRTSKGLGLMHTGFYSAYEETVNDRLSKEVGMKFKIKKDCKINNLNFNITSNDFKSLKFRVNFYKVENGIPTTLIVDQDIIFEITDGFLGWFKVDLKPYSIYLDPETKDIAVTIQWLESVKASDSSKYFSISTSASPLETSFYREKAMDKWFKSGQSLSFYLDAMCN